MVNLSHEVWMFFSSVFEIWEAYVFAGIVGVGVGIYERFKERSVPWPAFKYGMLAFLLVSLFMAWREQYHAAAQAREELQKLSKPEMSALLNQMVVGDLPETKGCQIFLDISVRNSGSPSIAYVWTLSMDSPAVNRIEASFIPDDYSILSKNGERYAVFRGNMRLEQRTISAPVQQGMLVGGWLRFALPNVRPEQCKNAQKTLYFRDITDREYSLPFRMPENENSPRISPSSGDSPFIFK